MNWYKKNAIEEYHSLRDKTLTEAEDKASVLGHNLKGWTSLNTCRCRKCGAYAKVHDLLISNESSIYNKFYGAAFLNKCNVVFEEEDKYEFPEYSIKINRQQII